MNTNVEFSTNVSIIVQLIVGIVMLQSLLITLPEEHKVLMDVLYIEFGVQVVQFSFYVLLLRELSKKVTGMAATRYFDWVITTPLMLFTIILYLRYKEFLEARQNGENPELTTTSFIEKERDTIIQIGVLNMLMIVFGYLGETGVMDRTIAGVLGFVFFFMSFYVIYKEYALNSKLGLQIFYILFIVWSLYGVAYFLPEVAKNNSFNVLDLIAKNFFGLFIALEVTRLTAKA
jgi:bacteriorhodopsin